MKKKNKGFTLIELLAVIVILGIILTIVVSNVVKYIGKAREGAFKDTYAKVLKDVSNKIALNDLGDTEGVVCSPSTCASLYDVPKENIQLYVSAVDDEEYMVYMNGIGSYAGINLDATNCPKNAGFISSTSLSSTINTDGDVKPVNNPYEVIGGIIPTCSVTKNCSEYSDIINNISDDNSDNTSNIEIKTAKSFTFGTFIELHDKKTSKYDGIFYTKENNKWTFQFKDGKNSIDDFINGLDKLDKLIKGEKTAKELGVQYANTQNKWYVYDPGDIVSPDKNYFYSTVDFQFGYNDNNGKELKKKVKFIRK